MPTLSKIVVQDFRNIALQELEFSPNVNCITGGNGEGKTNLLDAVWYLAMTKSAFGAADRVLVRHGCSSFALAGTFLLPGGGSSRITLQVAPGSEKKLRKDDKPIERVSSHIGFIPVVMVSPSDESMVSDSGEERRRFANSVLSQMSAEYLAGMQQYNRLLAQRNSLLKADRPDEDLLGVIDSRMAEVAAPLFEARNSFVQKLNPVLGGYYSRISGGREEVSVEYRSQLSVAAFEDLMKENRARDLALGYTLAGLQRDDFLFRMDSHSIRNCGSQGQQKSFLVALKFAQYEIMKGECGTAPILLLDDLFDKLDMSRVQALLAMVAGSDFGQIFLSDSNKVRLSSMVDTLTEDRSYFEAKGGVFTRRDA